MTQTRTVTEAETRFGECLHATEQGDRVVFTRDCQPVAALLPIEDLRRLQSIESTSVSGGLASLAGGWEGSDEFVARVEEVYCNRSGGRSLP